MVALVAGRAWPCPRPIMVVDATVSRGSAGPPWRRFDYVGQSLAAAGRCRVYLGGFDAATDLTLLRRIQSTLGRSTPGFPKLGRLSFGGFRLRLQRIQPPARGSR